MTVELYEETASTSLPDASDRTGASAGSSLPAVETNTPKALHPGRRLAAAVLVSFALTSPGAMETVYLNELLSRRRNEAAESGTVVADIDPELTRYIRELFEQGASEFFEDGMHSGFSRSLLAAIRQNGRETLRAVADYFLEADASPDVLSEALRWLGEIKDTYTFRERWLILEQSLRHESPRVRDGAVIGFATLDDPRARTLMTEAARTERIAEIRRLMEQVVDQLNATAEHAPAAPQR